MDALREIEELVRFERRAPGSDAERRAAGHLARRLEALALEPQIEPIRVRPNYALAHALHSLVAVAGSVVSVSSPAAGMALLLVAAASAFGDLTGSFFIFRSLFPARASQNVFAGDGSGRRGKLVLVAHYDAGRSGAVFGRRNLELRARLSRILHRQLGAFEPLFWSIALIVGCVALRLLGVNAGALTVVQFVPTVLLIASIPLLVDIALSPVTPGASDNASGVATVLRLADRYVGALDHFELCVLFPGAAEGLLLGSRQWLRRHRLELDAERTLFLGVEGAGAGTVRYTTKEGYIFGSPYHPALLELCREIAADDEESERRYGARPFTSRGATDAHAARSRGYAAVSIRCLNALDYAPNHHQPTDTPDRIDPAALERAYGFCCELVELIDERIGPRL